MNLINSFEESWIIYIGDLIFKEFEGYFEL